MRSIFGFIRGKSWVFLLVGAAGLAWHNWRAWRRDAAALADGPADERISPSAYASWPHRPAVSALVAAWNEAGNIEAHIRSFLALSYPEKELVLCAGGADGTYELAQRLAGPTVHVLEQQPGEGKQAALRRCLADARGGVILLSDADCEFSDDAWLRLIEPLACGEAQVVTGVSVPKVGQRANDLVRYQWYADALWAHHVPRTIDGMLGRNCALWRSVLDEVGGFDVPVRTGTDYVLSRQIENGGHTIYTVPKSRVATEYPDSPAAYLKMWRRWNKNLVLQGVRFGAWRHVRGVLTAAGLYGLVLALPVTTAVVGPAGWGSGLLLFGAAAANRLRRYALGARLVEAEGAAPVVLTASIVPQVVVYTGLDMLAVLLAVYDAANPRRRGRW